MGQFFRGWRRKIGVVTLMMALVSMAGWVWSGVALDSTQTGTAESTFSQMSINCNLYLFRLNPMPNWKSILWHSANLNSPPLSPWDGFEPLSQIQIAGFEFASGQHKKLPAIKLDLLIVPYWSIVIPLYLFSALLLLIKSRQSTAEKSDEPISTEGA